MEDLRLNSTDGEHLVLESQDGSRYRVVVDESLRAAVRASVSATGSQTKLSPREIQAAIRSGSSVSQLVESSGDPRDFIEKFAQPVLDEIAHVLTTALGVRISIAGDRYNEVSQIGFGEIIASRLNASGVTLFDWTAYRDENHSWRIVVNYELNGNKQSGVWSFDIKKLLLAPENENAVALSTQNQLTQTPKLKPVETTREESATQHIADTAALPETQKFETVIPIGRASDRVVIEKPAADAKLAESKDLLDALKKKREERAQDQAATQVVDLVMDEITITAKVDAETSEPQPTPAPVRRSGRPSIPSFDEIVQGTKSEEE